MHGYDIDGVMGKIVPEWKDAIIVSGRHCSEWGKTMVLLRELGVPETVPVYLRPFGDNGDRAAAAYWKMVMIHEAGLTEFYDDDPLVIRTIEESCPKCMGIWIKS